MAAKDILITCKDPIAPGNQALWVTFAQGQRSGFKYSSQAPGGDFRASWSVSCDQLTQTGRPPWQSLVEIDDPVRGTYLWRGVLQKPTSHYERGKLASVDFEALGTASASLRQFSSKTVFGDAATQATVITTGASTRVVCTDLEDAMLHVLTIADLVNGVQTNVATSGITFGVDTQDFRGYAPEQAWSELNSLTNRLATPFVWMVYADAAGNPALYWLAQPSNPEYFERGHAKENTLEIDASEIANLVYVTFQGDDTIEEPVGPLDYTATSHIQTHFVNVSEEIKILSEAQGFAGQLYNKFNVRAVTGGRIVLDRDIRALFAGSSTPVMIPITEVRAGKVIQTRTQREEYLNNATLIHSFVRSAEYDEDSCTTSLSPAAYDEAGKQARYISALAGRAGFSWSYLSRSFARPERDLYKFVENLVATDKGYYGRYYSGTIESHPYVLPTGWTTHPGSLPPFTGSSAPPAWGDTPPPSGSSPIVVQSAPPILLTTSENPTGGTFGGTILPQALPPHRVNYPAVFSTADNAGALTAGERLHCDAQESFIETFTISTLDQVPVTCEVTVDVWNWDSMSIREAAYFTMTLTADTDKREVYATPKLLLHGDQLRWSVDVADVEAILCCALDGWKHWGDFPVLIGPSWVPNS